MTPVLSTGTAVQVAASTARPAARWTMSAVTEGGVPVQDPHTARSAAAGRSQFITSGVT
jgi:hypothetical protein